jgi:hypothetical protein
VVTFGLSKLPSENLPLRVERRGIVAEFQGVAAPFDGDHVEPGLAPGGRRHLREVLPRGADDPAPLGGGDRLLGRPEAGDLAKTSTSPLRATMSISPPRVRKFLSTILYPDPSR